MSDLIDRAQAMTELQMSAKRLTLAYEAHGEGRVEYSDIIIRLSDALDTLRGLPSAQPEEHTKKRTETRACDLISRQYLVEHVKACMENDRLMKTADKDEILQMIADVPSAQQERCEDCENFNKTRSLIPQPERKKGRWIDGSIPTYAACSECGYQERYAYENNYCPNCGADMRGEQDE